MGIEGVADTTRAVLTHATSLAAETSRVADAASAAARSARTVDDARTVLDPIVGRIDQQLVALRRSADALDGELRAAAEADPIPDGMRLLRTDLPAEELASRLGIAGSPLASELGRPMHEEAARVLGKPIAHVRQPDGRRTFLSYNVQVGRPEGYALTDSTGRRAAITEQLSASPTSSITEFRVDQDRVILLRNPDTGMEPVLKHRSFGREPERFHPTLEAADERILGVHGGDYSWRQGQASSGFGKGERAFTAAKGTAPDLAPWADADVGFAHVSARSQLQETWSAVSGAVAPLEVQREALRTIQRSLLALDGAHRPAGTSDAFALEGAELLRTLDGRTFRAAPIGATPLVEAGPDLGAAWQRARALEPDTAIVVLQDRTGTHQLAAIEDITTGERLSPEEARGVVGGGIVERVHPDVRVVAADDVAVAPRAATPDELELQSAARAEAAARQARSDLSGTRASLADAMEPLARYHHSYYSDAEDKIMIRTTVHALDNALWWIGIARTRPTTPPAMREGLVPIRDGITALAGEIGAWTPKRIPTDGQRARIRELQQQIDDLGAALAG